MLYFDLFTAAAAAAVLVVLNWANLSQRWAMTAAVVHVFSPFSKHCDLAQLKCVRGRGSRISACHESLVVVVVVVVVVGKLLQTNSECVCQT